MDTKTKVQVVTLEAALLEWQQKHPDPQKDIGEGVEYLLSIINGVRWNAEADKAFKIELAKMRHPANWRRADDREF